jgi:membrane protein implicated in regulation of membrane protease activity
MEPLTLTWWVWLIFGIILMIAELLAPTGFFLFFFGVGGLVTGLLASLGFSSFPVEGCVFIGISLFCILVLRKPLLATFHFRNQTHSVDSLIGETGRALEVIAPQATGRIEMRGSTWTAVNTGSESIALDARCRVEKVKGLTLHVKL